MSKRFPQFVLLCSVWFISPASLADDAPVKRVTDRADSDLVTALLARGMTDTANKFCETGLSRAPSGSDDAARWLIEWSRVKIAEMLRAAPEDSAAFSAKAIAELERFLGNHPEHPREAWLLFQKELVSLADVRRAVLMASVKPPADPMRDQVLKQMVETSIRLRDLSQRLEEEIAIARNASRDNQQVRELISLAILVASRRIESVMLRGELFEAGSDDFIASANESREASQELLTSLPAGSEGRDELTKHLAESLRRLGELEQAADAVRPLLLSSPDDASLRALAARILIDQDNVAQATRLLDAWTSGNASSNLDIDLVRLQVAIREAQEQPTAEAQKTVGDWIQRIGTRHGDFARRRAERLVLGTSIATGGNKLDPRIIIAQAATRLREGNAQQAAEMLESASRAATEPAAALQLAIAGAAAFQKAEDIASAARLLRETSLTHYEQVDAPKLHLQSALLQSQTAAPEALIEHLQEGIMTWPSEPASMTAIDWLIRIHDARGQWLEKAEAATLGHPSWMTRERLEQATTQWADAIIAVPFAERDPLARKAIDAFGKYDASAGANESTAFLATLFRNRDGLSGVDANASGPAWIRWLLLIRKGGAVTETPDLTGVTEPLRVAAADRLIADGNVSVQEQKAMGQAVLSLVGTTGSIQAAQAHGWLGDWKIAESMLDELRRQAPGDLSIAQQSASLLARAPDERARRAGLKLWMSLSSQLKQGSDPWHQAKLATIATMKSLGESEEAKRLADFILLTQPDLAPQWVKQYRDASR